MRILLANANTTQAVTDACIAEARRCAAPGTEIEGVTADFGASIVTARPENIIAAHAALGLLARHHHGFDAAILSISFDSGLFAARELMPIPILGMTEAALHTACMLGTRVGVITFGHASIPLYRDLISTLGLEARITGLRTIDVASVSAYLSPQAQEDAILATAETLKREDGADIVVICGAALAGIGHQLQSRSSVALLDGIGCAVRQAELIVRMGVPFRGERPALATSARFAGIDPALAGLLRGKPGPENG
jgi:allantoin racemase